MRNNLLGALNTITLLITIPALLCGIWLWRQSASGRSLDKTMMGIGVLILLVSALGFMGPACLRDRPTVIVTDNVLQSTSGCCFKYQSQTTWILSPSYETSSTHQSILCYNCQSCRDEMNRNWRKAAFVYIGFLAFLVAVGYCAVRNRRY